MTPVTVQTLLSALFPLGLSERSSLQEPPTNFGLMEAKYRGRNLQDHYQNVTKGVCQYGETHARLFTAHVDKLKRYIPISKINSKII